MFPVHNCCILHSSRSQCQPSFSINPPPLGPPHAPIFPSSLWIRARAVPLVDMGSPEMVVFLHHPVLAQLHGAAALNIMSQGCSLSVRVCTCRKGRLQTVAEGQRVSVRGLLFLMSGQLQMMPGTASVIENSIQGAPPSPHADAESSGEVLPLQ